TALIIVGIIGLAVLTRVAWTRGYPSWIRQPRQGRQKESPPPAKTPTIGEINEAIRSAFVGLEKEISELKTNQGLLLSRQAMMQQTLEQRLPSARPEVEVPERGSTDAAVAIAGRLTPNEDNGRSPYKKTAAQESSFEESAQLAYLRLVRGQAASPDP